jgi:putative transposase
LIEWRGKPAKLRVDNGPEFISAAMELWAEKKKLTLKCRYRTMVTPRSVLW